MTSAVGGTMTGATEAAGVGEAIGSGSVFTLLPKVGFGIRLRVSARDEDVVFGMTAIVSLGPL